MSTTATDFRPYGESRLSVRLAGLRTEHERVDERECMLNLQRRALALLIEPL